MLVAARHSPRLRLVVACGTIGLKCRGLEASPSRLLGGVLTQLEVFATPTHRNNCLCALIGGLVVQLQFVASSSSRSMYLPVCARAFAKKAKNKKRLVLIQGMRRHAGGFSSHDYNDLALTQWRWFIV